MGAFELEDIAIDQQRLRKAFGGMCLDDALLFRHRKRLTDRRRFVVWRKTGANGLFGCSRVELSEQQQGRV